MTNPQSYLSNIKSKLDLVYTTSELNQAVETLYAFDHLDRNEYENWIAEITAIAKNQIPHISVKY